MKFLVALSALSAASAFPLVERQVVSSLSSAASSALTAASSTASSAAVPTATGSTNSSTGTNSTASSNLTTFDLTYPITNESVPLYYNNTVPPLAGNPIKNGTNSSLAFPYQPAGGDNPKNPVYNASSNFDFQSLNLALNQELIELDLFNYGLAKFTPEEFEAVGIDASQQSLLRFMAQQEIGHASALSNILGPDRSAKQCVYQYPFQTVPEFIVFSQLLTRFGESGVLGFLPHLDNRANAQILLQSITTESRQQMSFRQMQGLFPYPVWFETGIPQSWAWTLLSPFIKSCPANNPRIEFQNFPALNITNQPPAVGGESAVSTNRSLTAAGRNVTFSFEAPGKQTGYNNSYVTATVAGEPKYMAWVSQLNVTYSNLTLTSNTTGWTIQPNGTVFPDGAPIVNGSMFVALTDSNPFLTPYNLSLINNHTRAGPAIYQSG